MDVFSRWAGETTNEIDMHLHHFNMLDTSIENKKPTTIACHIVKMKKNTVWMFCQNRSRFEQHCYIVHFPGNQVII